MAKFLVKGEYSFYVANIAKAEMNESYRDCGHKMRHWLHWAPFSEAHDGYIESYREYDGMTMITDEEDI